MRNEVANSIARSVCLKRNEAGPGARRLSIIVRAAWIVGVLACALQAQSSAQAMTLYRISVQSALDQPLRARISLQGGTQIGAECVKATIESMEGSLLGKAEIRLLLDGTTPILLLSTVDPVREPAINLAVQVICLPQEKRDYAVLLDLNAPGNVATAKTIPAIGAAGAPLRTPTAMGSLEKISRGYGAHSGGLLGEGLSLFLSRTLSEESLPPADSTKAASASPGADVAPPGATAEIGARNPGLIQRLQAYTLNPAASAMAITMSDWIPAIALREYWQPMLLGCAGLLVLLILSLRADARATKKNARQPASRRSTRDNRKPERSKMLDPIPYIKPNLKFTPAPARAISAKPEPDAVVARSAEPVHGVETTARSDERFQDDPQVGLPQCRAEEIEDEMQLAQFWMDFGQPLRALEVLESRWGREQPGSPLPWQYLLQIYKITGDFDKYRKLIGRYQAAFGKSTEQRSTAPNASVDEILSEAYRMRA